MEKRWLDMISSTMEVFPNDTNYPFPAVSQNSNFIHKVLMFSSAQHLIIRVCCNN